MLWVIVGIVVLGAVFVVGALLGSSVSRTVAGDRTRRLDRDRSGRDRSDAATTTPPTTRPAARPLTTRPTTRRTTRSLLDG